MDVDEGILVLGVWFVALLVLFTPLITIYPNDLIDSWSQYVFLITNFSLFKSFLLIEGSLCIILFWSLHNNFRTYIVEKLGFQGNAYLFSSFLLAISLSNIIGMGEIVKVFDVYTTVLTLTPLYYIVQIVLIMLLWLCLYILIYKQKSQFRWHVVSYHGKRQIDKDSTMDGGALFGSLHHDE